MKITLSELTRMIRDEKFRIIRETRKQYGKAAVVTFDEPIIGVNQDAQWFSVTCAYRVIVTLGETRTVSPGWIAIAA